MGDFRIIAGLTRTVRDLLRDRMITGAAVTVAPPGVTITGIDGARVNLYPIEVLEHPGLKNEPGPRHGPSGGFGRPPLWLNLRYMLTAYADSEVMEMSELTAEEILGDAMQILHMFGGRMDALTFENLAPPEEEEPILDPVLRGEAERVKLTLYPATLEEITRIWSALSQENFRRTVIYEATVIQIDDVSPRRIARPVMERRVFAALARRPVIERAFVTPPPGGPETEARVAVGEQITLVVRDATADRLFVQFGRLAPIRVAAPVGGRIRVTVPDDTLPLDIEPPSDAPIPPGDRLQPGTLQIRLLAEVPVEGVAGALERGRHIEEQRPYASNTILMQLVPAVQSITPSAGPAGTLAVVAGSRLWHPAATEAFVLLGDAAIRIMPRTGMADPTPTSVQIPVREGEFPPQEVGDQPYPLAVMVDGARSRDAGLGFRVEPDP